MQIQKQEQTYYPNKYPQYQITMKQINSNSIILRIANIQKGYVYSNTACQLQKINAKAIQKAFQENQKLITYNIQVQQSQNDKLSLILTIIINSLFIKQIKQHFQLPLTQKYSLAHAYQQKIHKLQTQLQKIRDYKQKHISLIVNHRQSIKIQAPNFYDEDYNQQQAMQYTQLIEIILPEKTRYLITLGMFVKSTNPQNYIQFYDNNNNQFLCSLASGMYIATQNNFYPIIIEFIVNSPSKNFLHKISLANTYDYPAQLYNVTISAQIIS